MSVELPKYVELPIVDYLVLDPIPHLVAHECTSCAARFFDRRNACGKCGALDFRPTSVSTVGEVVAYTIVSKAGPGVSVPFVAAVIDCAGTSVSANLINTPAQPERIKLGLPVRLTTYSLGCDETGAEAIAFGFEPS
jgi:uncharacterized OB-fold protein